MAPISEALHPRIIDAVVGALAFTAAGAGALSESMHMHDHDHSHSHPDHHDQSSPSIPITASNPVTNTDQLSTEPRRSRAAASAEVVGWVLVSGLLVFLLILICDGALRRCRTNYQKRVLDEEGGVEFTIVNGNQDAEIVGSGNTEDTNALKESTEIRPPPYSAGSSDLPVYSSF
ncbi:hypothetical protein TWF281_010429 [Arthrobotrys megalospora]